MNKDTFTKNKIKELESLIEQLSSCEIEIGDGYSEISLGQNVNGENLKNLLRNLGVETDELDYSSSHNMVSFPIKKGDLAENTVIFPTLESFWIKASSLDDELSFYIILDGGERVNNGLISFLNPEPIIKKINLFLKWRKLINKIATHSLSDKCIYYVPNKDNGKEVEITIPSNNLFKIDKIVKTDEINYEYVNELWNAIEADDVMTSERKSILRLAISDLVDEKCILTEIIEKDERIYNRYKDLVDLYTKKFSIDKVLSEIESKYIEFTSKINDIISSTQNKAFAIPGALIAVSALIKTDNLLIGSLVIIGLFMIFLITFVSNELYKDSLDELNSSLEKSFKQFEVLEKRTQICIAASDTNTKLTDKISKVKSRLKLVDVMSFVMLIVGGTVVYLNNQDELNTILDKIVKSILQSSDKPQ
ncbi:hypothetical protein [uncultured Gilliamella sp.]|uniref:hypothetical protein n=1 Tax=uncultured Gilliamella sp. TaxID=1193505 RepID=UPI0025D60BCF|nr:hypothetical protein [uncultured Gilliamella sp.]